jgi:LysR family cyn operon transcriptional activator
MEIHQLRYLRAVVELGSVTAAGEAEHVSQPSISKQIRLLERELDVPLFHRVGRRVVPTAAALELVDCARRVLDDLAATAAALSSPASAVGGRLHICATETVANYLLPAALVRLTRQMPLARIRVEMLGTDDALTRILSDEFDFAIVPLPVADTRLEVRELLSEEVLVAMSPGHPFAAMKSVPLRSLLEEVSLVLSMPGHGLRAQVDEAAHALGVEITGRVELRSQHAQLAMVAGKGGIALAPAMSVIGRDDVVSRPLVPPLRRTIGWVRRRGRHIPPVGLQLLDLLASDRALACTTPPITAANRHMRSPPSSS